MSEIHSRCVDHGKSNGRVNYVCGANIAGFQNVADAMLSLIACEAKDQSAGIERENRNEEVMGLYRTGHYDHAVTVAEAALKVAEQNAGPDHPDVALSLNNLALLYDTQGGYARAVPLYKRALVIVEKALGPDHPCVSTSLENLGGLYRATGQPSEAEKLEARAKNIRVIQR